nr:DNA polymerase subunit gamma-1, mitochondrial [Danaus plexippus plexippus]
MRNIKKLCHIYRRGYSNDILPSSESVIIRQNKPEKDIDNLETPVEIHPENDPKEFRVNDVNIQMISKNIYDQLFRTPQPTLDAGLIKSCLNHLEKHGIDIKKSTYLPDVQLKIPKLQGKDIEEHFFNIGETQCAPYRTLLQKLSTNNLPKLPKIQFCQCWRPIMSSSCTYCVRRYGWVSEPLANDNKHEHHNSVRYEDLIPLETDGFEPVGDITRPRMVVGHNVSYDRSKIKEQYWLNKTGVRFMDTMSMHICVSGVTSYQRTVLKDKNKEPHPHDDEWREVSSLNGLSDVHRLYCGVAIDKQTRDVFVEGCLEDVQNNFQDLMKYCAGDVIATHNVLRALLPLFLERFPHPVTFAGMLELGSAYLPVNSNWSQYLDSADTVFEDLKLESQQILSSKADEACRMMENEGYKEDPWMWDQDWSVQKLKLKKNATKKKDTIESKKPASEDVNRISSKFELLSDEYVDSLKTNEKVTHDFENLNKKFKYLYDLGDLLPVKRPFLAGYPAWYRKLCTKPGKDPDWRAGANNITTSMQITPKLLRLSWEGYPLHHLQSEGWGFLVPYSRHIAEDAKEPLVPLEKILEICPLMTSKADYVESELHMLPQNVEEDLSRRAYYARKKKEEQAVANQYHGLGVWCGVQIQGCCHFLRLPHKDGPKYKVGNPLARDFLNMFSQNVLSAQGNEAEKVSWEVIFASEPTWMTASNAQSDRVGSELRSMVTAPPGYRFVGADVDSQELWIAALLGDSSLMCGGSAFGWAVLAGDKRTNTDLHSLTAVAAGVRRDHAKVINYARIYGAGQNFAERLLKQFNPTMTISEAKSKAAKMFTTTKGKRVYRLKEKFMEGFMDEESGDQTVEMTSYQAMRLAKLSGRTTDEMFERPRWEGGTESHMFNKLEEIAESSCPRTSFLEGRLSRSLEAAHNGGGTKLNWVVQSAAADFLHLMLVSMTHLQPSARFCLSFHDEVRYLVPEEHKYEAALALQITNLLTRAFCSQRVGIHDLPMSVAFFSSVEVDRVLRKEANMDCVTPSNPHGLEKGYGIPNGESLTIYDVLEKTDCNRFCTKETK